MTPEEVKAIVRDTPGMTLDQGLEMSAFIKANHIEHVLELGTGHGVSTLYIAAALPDSRTAHVLTLDQGSALLRKPTLQDLADKCPGAIRKRIRSVFNQSYHHTLRIFLQRAYPQFDLVYVDDAHDWVQTGFGFLLADKLLKRGGWMIFDDVTWTAANSPSLRSKSGVLPEKYEFPNNAHVGWVFELLVAKHPDYLVTYIDGNWAIAQKNHPTELDWSEDDNLPMEAS